MRFGKHLTRGGPWAPLSIYLSKKKKTTNCCFIFNEVAFDHEKLNNRSVVKYGIIFKNKRDWASKLFLNIHDSRKPKKTLLYYIFKANLSLLNKISKLLINFRKKSRLERFLPFECYLRFPRCVRAPIPVDLHGNRYWQYSGRQGCQG